ncbi:MAG: bis(5'-nucleosyl)-tetraphosphatase (symmetrical) YqeK [Coriobacteriia bacterium]
MGERFDFEDMKAVVHARLSEKAALHCDRVAEMAVTLASVYGADQDMARLAGLLHDWDREQKGSELIAAAEADGIEITEADRDVPYLLHAQTGAEALRRAYPWLPAEVISAVRCHTVGRADMGDLDMIVYLADMIAPARDFPGVEELREAIGVVSLGELFARGYQSSVMHLVRTRRIIHPDTFGVWNHLVARERHA